MSLDDQKTQQRIVSLLESYTPPKCSHPISQQKGNVDAQSMIITILRSIPNDSWDPMNQYQHHFNEESSLKNTDPKYSNFYIEKIWYGNESQSESEDRPPEDPYNYHAVMCNNCWINLIPYLDNILHHIVSAHNQMNGKAQQYIESFEAFTHWLFMKYLLQQLNIIRYILRYKRLYKLFFSYMINIINILHVQCNLHLFIQTQKSIGAPPLDFNNPSPHGITVIPQTLEQQEGSYLSLMIFDSMRMGGSFIYTTRYWKKRHFKYVLKHKNMLSLIQNDILKRCLERCADLHSYKRARFSLKYEMGDVMSDIILWVFILRKFIQKHKKYQDKKWSKFDPDLALNIAQFMMYIALNSGFQFQWLTHESMMNMVKTQCNEGNMKNINDTCPNEMMQIYKQCMDALLTMNESKINFVCNKWVTEHGTEHFYEMMLCSSPNCNKQRWKKEYKYDKKAAFCDWSFIKTKFFKCSNCRVAFYCSRHC
eukprot:295708_1